MMRFSRMTRKRLLRCMVPESTRQPATVPTRLIENVRRTERAAQVGFAFLGLEHAFQGLLQIVGHLVNDVVAANLHALALGQHAGFFVGHHVEADDDRIGSVGQMHVGFADAADRGLQHFDFDFRMLELAELFENGFDRAAHIGPQDDVQRLHLLRCPNARTGFPA